MTSRPKVSFIIPILYLERPLNKKRFFMPRSTINDVLNDIENNVTTDYEVIVIANSRDKSLVDFVTTDSRITKFVLNSVNPGVARSWNMGAEMSEGEHLCFVSDDVRIGKNAIEQLVSALDTRPEVDEVGPRGDLYENGKSLRFVGITEPEYTDVISGFLFLVREVAYWKVGGFDVNYTPAGCEEIDFSFAIRKGGGKCLVLPNLDITHNEYHGVSAHRTNIRYFENEIDTLDLHEKNSSYFLKKWGIEN
jgi:GT2 family glycosyltransferase